MTGRSPTSVHHERQARKTFQALQQYVRDKRQREKAAKRAARQQQEQAR